MPQTPRYGEKNPTPTWRAVNLAEVREWLGRSFERVMVLHEHRPAVLETVLGPKQQTWVGGSGRYRNAIWRCDAEDIPVWVLCSKRGTDYEVEHPVLPWSGALPSADVDKILRFLAWLYLRLEEVAPVEKFGPVVPAEEDPYLAAALRQIAAERGDAPDVPATPHR